MKISFTSHAISVGRAEEMRQSAWKEPGYIELATQPASLGTTYIFLEPLALITLMEGALKIETHDGVRISENPIEELNNLLSPIFSLALDTPPMAAGYFGYEFSAMLNGHPCNSGRQDLPDCYFGIFRKVIVLRPNETRLITFEVEGFLKPLWELPEIPQKMDRFEIPALRAEDDFISNIAEDFSNFTSKRYSSLVSETKELILDGEVYQVNLSRQFRIPCGYSPWMVYEALSSSDPSEYSAYINGKTGDTSFCILSASPELFFTISDRTIRCSPIKGTRPRESDSRKDEVNYEKLLSSEKDHAELAMIVDLVRNDLNRVCKLGTVKVERHARIAALPHVFHLISDVSGRLKDEVSFFDILEALFPCGSVTGAPKRAAMSYISKFEQCPRGVYTGAIGFLGPGGRATFSVPIRTAVIIGGEIIFNAGGGIVVGSDPHEEDRETIYKSRGIVSALKLCASELLP